MLYLSGWCDLRLLLLCYILMDLVILSCCIISKVFQLVALLFILFICMLFGKVACSAAINLYVACSD